VNGQGSNIMPSNISDISATTGGNIKTNQKHSALSSAHVDEAKSFAQSSPDKPVRSDSAEVIETVEPPR
jgi:hypothetical protein